MEKITATARREFSFPSPVDMHREHRDQQDKKENEERQPALQSTKPKRTPVAVSTRDGKMMKRGRP
jgi:hypothetical protein